MAAIQWSEGELSIINHIITLCSEELETGDVVKLFKNIGNANQKELFAVFFYEEVGLDLTTVAKGLEAGVTDEMLNVSAGFNDGEVTLAALPDTVVEVGQGALNNVAATKLVIPGAAKLSPSAVYGNSSIKEVELSGKVKIVSKSCFQDCKSLEKVIIGEGVQIIDSGAFAGCDSLKEVILPDSLVGLGVQAFTPNSDGPVLVRNKGIDGIMFDRLPEEQQNIYKKMFGIEVEEIPEEPQDAQEPVDNADVKDIAAEQVDTVEAPQDEPNVDAQEAGENGEIPEEE